MFVFGLLAVSIGAVLLVSGGLRFAMYQLTNAFRSATREALVETIATSSLATGFSALAGAVWAALAPLLPFIAIGLAIAGVMYYVYDSVNTASTAFTKYKNEMMEAGDMAVIQFDNYTKLGGILEGIKQVWNSWDVDKKEYRIEVSTYKALDKMGLAPTMDGVATWVVRIKTLLMGIWEGITDAFKPTLDIIGRESANLQKTQYG